MTSPLPQFEARISVFSEQLVWFDVPSAIIRVFSKNRVAQNSHIERLWLLSHYIALQRSQANSYHSIIQLNALFYQLSHLSSHIRLSMPHPSDGDAPPKLPSYIIEQIKSILDGDGISHLLEKFTS